MNKKGKPLTVQEAGRKGGNSTLKKYTSEHFKRLRQRGIEKSKEAKKQGVDNPIDERSS